MIWELIADDPARRGTLLMPKSALRIGEGGRPAWVWAAESAAVGSAHNEHVVRENLA